MRRTCRLVMDSSIHRRPDTTGAVNALKTATLTFAAAAIANIIYPNPNEVGDAATGANNQNLGGEIILNTGVIEP